MSAFSLLYDSFTESDIVLDFENGGMHRITVQDTTREWEVILLGNKKPIIHLHNDVIKKEFVIYLHKQRMVCIFTEVVPLGNTIDIILQRTEQWVTAVNGENRQPLGQFVSFDTPVDRVEFHGQEPTGFRIDQHEPMMGWRHPANEEEANEEEKTPLLGKRKSVPTQG